MMKMFGRLAFMLMLVVVAGCSNEVRYEAFRLAEKPALPKPEFDVMFQGGQRVHVQLLGENKALQEAFLTWTSSGVYNQAPVYRNLPGVFVLAGKPRLAGESFVHGVVIPPTVTPKGELEETKIAESRAGHVGLVVHADGTVGPELIFVYGTSPRNCCEAPKNVRIGAIREGRLQLRDVLRGDNMLGISVSR